MLDEKESVLSWACGKRLSSGGLTCFFGDRSKDDSMPAVLGRGSGSGGWGVGLGYGVGMVCAFEHVLSASW